MSGDLLVARWTRPARLHAAGRAGAIGLAAVVALAGVVGRTAGWLPAAIVAVAGEAAVLLLAQRRARRFDRRWLVATLDAAGAEDSSDLLFADPATLGRVQALQRARIAARMGDEPAAIRPVGSPWPIAAAWATALAVVAAALLWPVRPEGAALAPAAEGAASPPGVPRLAAQRLRVVPPAYTGLPPRDLAVLDARVPAGSRLEWTLLFAPAADAPRLAVLSGGAVPLARAGEVWRGVRVADRALLYRVVPADRAPVPPLHRIALVADRPPAVRLVEPAATLVPAAAGQRGWSLVFAASDDYGVDPAARLRLVLAQGDGENVRFAERIVAVRGTGPATNRRFAARIDLAAVGFTEPGDLVAQLLVADTRRPQPQRVAGPSVILRRASPAAGEGAGLEGAVRRALPAYFRSQRQIIIDAERLIAERRRLAPARALARSEGIGDDQRLLRLRYGQFMGEESGGEPEGEGGHDGDHAPQAAAPAAAAGFGMGTDVLAEYGHTHDDAEAATLLDPGTRATLRRALDAMWLSERALRQGSPQGALPHAYRALRFIKAVQQATRIFLARTATALPPVDLARRLTGVRTGLSDGRLPPAAATPVDAARAAIWRALARGDAAVPLDALDRWMRRRGGSDLALAAAADALRRDPECEACRVRLRALLWAATVPPAPAVARRAAGEGAGRRYLEALR